MTGKQVARLKSQEDAQWAYQCVSELRGKVQEKELKSHLQKLPAHLQTSGLAQTILFYAKKNKEIATKLCERLVGKSDAAQAVEELVNMSASLYRAKAREAMALANWLKRFAEAMIEDKGKGNE